MSTAASPEDGIDASNVDESALDAMKREIVLSHKSSLSYRLMWGEELLACKTLLAKPIVTTADQKSTSTTVILCTSKHPTSCSRVLPLCALRNHFKLRKPASLGGHYSNLDYCLALLDSTMPKLTNCGRYFRMRYAVYVYSKSWAQEASINCALRDNWRCRAAKPNMTRSELDSLLLHMGELHLYVNFDDQAVASGGLSRNHQNKLVYENISFFLNETPLSPDQASRMGGLVELNFQRLALSFRCFLKQLDEERIEPGGPSQLLDQIKYPKTLESFCNADQMAEQFVRNQSEMFAKFRGDACETRTQLPSLPIDADRFVLQVKRLTC